MLPKIGLNIVWVAPSHVLDYAKLAEEVGFESVWSGEHVGLPAGRDEDALIAAHNPWFGPHSPFVDPIVTLAAIAGSTERVRLGVGIYMLVLRDAILCGRELATLDVLSGGRLDLGIGLGWSEDEYRYTNNEWKTRGARTDELMDALTVLFTEENPEFHGRFFDFDPIGFEPKPVQRPRPKFHIGGSSEAALRRAVTRGDGYYGGGGPPERVGEIVEDVRKRLEVAGREQDDFGFGIISIDGEVPAETLERYAEVGVDRVVVTPFDNRVGEAGPESFDKIRAYARNLGLTSTG